MTYSMQSRGFAHKYYCHNLISLEITYNYAHAIIDLCRSSYLLGIWKWYTAQIT